MWGSCVCVPSTSSAELVSGWGKKLTLAFNVHCTLYMNYYTPPTQHSILYTLHSTFYTSHCICPSKCKEYNSMTSAPTLHYGQHCDWYTVDTLYSALLWSLSYCGNVEINYYRLKEVQRLFESRIDGGLGIEMKEERKDEYKRGWNQWRKISALSL